MRKLIYPMMVSLDGFFEGPGGDITWHVIDGELHQYRNDQQGDIDTYLLGRRIYENLNAFWPTADKDPSSPAYVIEFASIWRNMPKIVFSKSLQKVTGNARLASEDLAATIAKLKTQPGKNFSIGGASLASTAIKLGLVDEYQLFVAPVILGSGTPCFPPLDHSLNLKLIDTHTFGCGVVLLSYQHI